MADRRGAFALCGGWKTALYKKEGRFGSMELLAPAGNMEALIAAVDAGADAVYLGGKMLSARRGAGNFDADQLIRAAEYCHERDRFLYVTVNTLIKNSEFPILEEIAGQIARAGADAVIVQDMGVAEALREMIPGISLHASTQMAIHNRQGVDFLAQRGFRRVVLAREMSFREIADCAGRGVELEVFVHGALCVSCSGQCLMSSMIGGRSGNRGACAQPCRLPYRLSGPVVQDEGALLSTKDLNLRERLQELARAGVSSLKIEGRLKPPEYVATVTAAYRDALDGNDGISGAESLKDVFNRGYTQGYGPGLIDRSLIENQDEKHREGRAERPIRPRPVSLSAILSAKVNEPLTLTLEYETDRVTVFGSLVAEAQTRPTGEDRLREQLEKTGGTPYRMDQVKMILDDNAFVPVSAVNELRRRGLTEMDKTRIMRNRGCGFFVNPPIRTGVPIERTFEKTLLSVASRDGQLLDRALDWGADEIVYEPFDVTETGLRRFAPKERFTLLLPATLNGEDLAGVIGFAEEDPRVQAVAASNPAHLSHPWTHPVRLDFAMNISNDPAVRAYGLPYMPSCELTAGEVRNLIGEKELFVYGRLPLMRLRHCPVRARMSGKHEDCALCDLEPEKGLERHVLRDRKGVCFPMRRLKTASGCIVELDNSVPLFLLRYTAKIPSAARWRVRLTDEGALSEGIVRLHRAALDGENFKALSFWADAEALNTTTGHYFRGVE